jgi:lysozyme family protein
MRANFDKCLSHVLKYEGGYSDHPSDPGGATNLGITHEVLAAWRGRPVTKADVTALTRAEAAEIYRARYWKPVAGDELPAGLDLAVFDCAVNQGVGRATKLLQMALGVTADGAFGPKTLAALFAADREATLHEFMARRMTAYGALTALFRIFGLGWSRRLIGTHAEAMTMNREIIQT